MTRGAAILAIESAGRAEAAIVSGHALDELPKDGKNIDDLFCSMSNIIQATEQRSGPFAVDREYSWKCSGLDLDGSKLGFIVKIKATVVVVTAWAIAGQ